MFQMFHVSNAPNVPNVSKDPKVLDFPNVSNVPNSPYVAKSRKSQCQNLTVTLLLLEKSQLFLVE